MPKRKQYTIKDFAAKIGKDNSTVWRWCTQAGKDINLKKYDAKKIEVAGKIFVEV